MKKVKYFLLSLDAVFVIFVIVVSLSPKSYGKQFLDYVGINPSHTDIDRIIEIRSPEDDLFVETMEHKRSDNIYEEVIINHDENSAYKFVELTIDNYRAFMLIVYDPANVKLLVGNGFDTPNNSGKITMVEMTEKYGAVAGINGGKFFDNGEYATDKPGGYIIQDNKIIWDEKGKVGNLIGFDNNNRLTLVQATGEEALNMGIRDALEFGPFLIVDDMITGEADQMGESRAARTIIAQRMDGIVLMLVTDGGSFVGPRMNQIINVLRQYGAYNAANLDGGLSSQMVIEGKNYTTVSDKVGNVVTVGRRVINGWGVFQN